MPRNALTGSSPKLFEGAASLGVFSGQANQESRHDLLERCQIEGFTFLTCIFLRAIVHPRSLTGSRGTMAAVALQEIGVSLRLRTNVPFQHSLYGLLFAGPVRADLLGRLNRRRQALAGSGTLHGVHNKAVSCGCGSAKAQVASSSQMYCGVAQEERDLNGTCTSDPCD